MSAFGVNFDGHYYVFHGYRYDRLSDAIDYARLIGARPVTGQLAAAAHLVDLKLPSASDRFLMASLNIDFENGRYGFEGYRYDHLADAVNYAHLCRRKSSAPNA